MVNTNLLKGKIVATGITQRKLADSVGMSVNSLNAKINGRKIFDADEVIRICDVLKITSPIEKCEIFFATIVPKMRHPTFAKGGEPYG